MELWSRSESGDCPEFSAGKRGRYAGGKNALFPRRPHSGEGGTHPAVPWGIGGSLGHGTGRRDEAAPPTAGFPWEHREEAGAGAGGIMVSQAAFQPGRMGKHSRLPLQECIRNLPCPGPHAWRGGGCPALPFSPSSFPGAFPGCLPKNWPDS